MAVNATIVAKATEQASEIELWKFKTTRATTIEIIAHEVARIASNDVTRTSRIAINEATTAIQAEPSEQISEWPVESGATTVIETTVVNDTTRIAGNDVARTAKIEIIASTGGKHASQTVAQADSGQTTNGIARIARNDWLTGVTIVGSDTTDQSLETGKHVARTCDWTMITGSTRINAPRIARAEEPICEPLDTHHKGGC